MRQPPSREKSTRHDQLDRFAARPAGRAQFLIGRQQRCGSERNNLRSHRLFWPYVSETASLITASRRRYLAAAPRESATKNLAAFFRDGASAGADLCRSPKQPGRHDKVGFTIRLFMTVTFAAVRSIQFRRNLMCRRVQNGLMNK